MGVILPVTHPPLVRLPGQQPRRLIGLDWANPLARGLLAAWGLNHPGRSKCHDYVSNRPVPLANSNNSTARMYGDGFMFRRNAAQSAVHVDVATIPTITRTDYSFSVVQHCALGMTGGSYDAFASIGDIGSRSYATFNSGSAGDRCQFWWGSSATTSDSSSAGASPSWKRGDGVGQAFTVAAAHRFGVGAGGVQVCINGKAIGSATSHTGSKSYTYNRLTFGGLTYDGGNTSGRESINGVSLFLWYDRALEDRELRALSIDPHQIFLGLF